jgi:hypothetical protein
VSLRDVIVELRADAASRSDFEASIPELQETDQILIQTVLRNIHDWLAPMEADGLISTKLELFTFDDVDLGMYPTFRLVVVIPRSDLTPIVIAPSADNTDRSRLGLMITSEGSEAPPRQIIFDRNMEIPGWEIMSLGDGAAGAGTPLEPASFDALIESLLRDRQGVPAPSQH